MNVALTAHLILLCLVQESKSINITFFGTNGTARSYDLKGGCDHAGDFYGSGEVDFYGGSDVKKATGQWSVVADIPNCPKSFKWKWQATGGNYEEIDGNGGHRIINHTVLNGSHAVIYSRLGQPGQRAFEHAYPSDQISETAFLVDNASFSEEYRVCGRCLDESKLFESTKKWFCWKSKLMFGDTSMAFIYLPIGCQFEYCWKKGVNGSVTSRISQVHQILVETCNNTNQIRIAAANFSGPPNVTCGERSQLIPSATSSAMPAAISKLPPTISVLNSSSASTISYPNYTSPVTTAHKNDTSPVTTAHKNDTSPVTISHKNDTSPATTSHMNDTSPVTISHPNDTSPVTTAHMNDTIPVTISHMNGTSVATTSLLNSTSSTDTTTDVLGTTKAVTLSTVTTIATMNITTPTLTATKQNTTIHTATTHSSLPSSDIITNQARSIRTTKTRASATSAVKPSATAKIGSIATSPTLNGSAKVTKPRPAKVTTTDYIPTQAVKMESTKVSDQTTFKDDKFTPGTAQLENFTTASINTTQTHLMTTFSNFSSEAAKTTLDSLNGANGSAATKLSKENKLIIIIVSSVAGVLIVVGITIAVIKRRQKENQSLFPLVTRRNSVDDLQGSLDFAGSVKVVSMTDLGTTQNPVYDGDITSFGQEDGALTASGSSGTMKRRAGQGNMVDNPLYAVSDAEALRY